jgi:thymidylate synthase
MINIITSVVFNKNKLAIGRNNELLFRFKDDMNFFKQTTIGNYPEYTNVVVMGYNTYLSIKKPLEKRINIVLTNKTELYNVQNYLSMLENNDTESRIYFMNLETFWEMYFHYKPVVFVIGGSQIYDLFIYRARNIYLTDIKTIDEKDIKFSVEKEPDTFLTHFPSKFKLKTISEKHISKNGLYSYRFLKYEEGETRSDEYQYVNLLKNIISSGNRRDDRTQTGTISIFGTQLRFNISECIPLMTLKQVPFRIILEELLWFCRGDTDSKILHKKNIHIWDGNTSREFLDKQGLTDYDEGVLGPGYGFQWRHQGAQYRQEYADTSKVDTESIGGFDQLAYVEHLLKTDPFSRRIVISAWNPSDFNKTALVPCHILLQFYVEQVGDEKHLSCQFYMRSNDVFLANVFNIVSYTVLTHILAFKCNMKPKEIIYSCGDAHIYSNHLEQVNSLFSRKPRPFPKLVLNESLKSKDWSEMQESDFVLIGYYPHPAIRAPMAI